MKKSNPANWRSINVLPKRQEADSWALKSGRHPVENIDESRLKKEIRRWSPYQAILISAPNHYRLLPLVRIGSVRKVVIAKNYFLTYAMGIVWAILAAAAAMLSYVKARPATGLASLACALVAAALMLDARKIRSSSHTLFERSLFIAWLRVSPRSQIGLIVWVVLVGIIGITQLWLNSTLGGWEPAAVKYGAITKSINAGEWWRLITGPYFHSSAVHFASNTLMAICIGPIALALIGWRSIIVFILANVVGAIAFLFFGNVKFDVYMGISAGVLALFSMLFAIAIRHPRFLPKGIANFFILIALVSTLLSEAISASSASSAHIVGILFGVTVGMTRLFSGHNIR